MEFGSRSSSRHYREESHLRGEIQRLHPPCHQRRASVSHQERSDGPPRNSQRLSAPAFEIATQSEAEKLTAKSATAVTSRSLRKKKSTRSAPECSLGIRIEVLHQMLGSRSKYSSSSFLPPSPLPSIFSDSTNSIRSIHLTIL
jgi:hypothetical protein